MQGGAPFFEVALNSPHALEQITMLRTHFGDRCTVGAGTAITVERCKAALDAGAQFLLTPGTPLDVFSYCAENDIALLPGVLTPTDVATSLQFGYKTMKLFPAGSMPRHYVKDLQGPFDGTNYMAIGGVSPANIREFFDAGCISVGLASSLMPKDAVAPPTTGKPAPPTSAAWWTRSSAEPEPIETFCNTRERMISHEDR